ncbi:MAG: M23 family metallopeptidase [Candidatus Cloacimonetes bacterium]|nr:M23 family metallopeptidase [Candidatus Cloacimonadota bacterium]
MNSRIAIMIILIMVILLVIVISDQVRIRYLEGKLNNLLILDEEGDSLVVYHPDQVKERLILITPGFADRFTNYKSPLSPHYESDYAFQDLVEFYIENRFQDHYGTSRGTKEKRRKHEGIDLFVAENTPVYPLADYGVVVQVSDNPNHLEWAECWDQAGKKDTVQIEYGKLVKVLYPDGLTSIYVHLNEVNVQEGDEVRGDTVLGLTGVTGNLLRSGKKSHLHLELRYLDGESFDPRWRLHWRGTAFVEFVKRLMIND